MFSSGTFNMTLEDLLSKVSESDILYHYFGISEIPCVVSSPLRVDNDPSFGIYTLDGNRIYWKDLARKTSGGLWDMLGEYWGVSYREVLKRVWEDLPNIAATTHESGKMKKPKPISNYNEGTDLQCRIRCWKQHDIEYWESFGISLEWLKYADIYPISHKIVIKGSDRFTFVADKYAYAYVERKEGKVTLKIYQPFSTTFKWSNRHDRSVISLWSKIPETGNIVCVCSSMKDALCLWCNTGIPCVAVQGEGYSMSDTAVDELKRRFNKVFILFDNDEAGLADGIKLAESTGFINRVLPFNLGGKDVSDIYKSMSDKEEFRKVMLDLFKE